MNVEELTLHVKTCSGWPSSFWGLSRPGPAFPNSSSSGRPFFDQGASRALGAGGDVEVGGAVEGAKGIQPQANAVFGWEGLRHRREWDTCLRSRGTTGDLPQERDTSEKEEGGANT